MPFDFGHADGQRFGQGFGQATDPNAYTGPDSVTVLPDIAPQIQPQSTWDKVKAFDFSGLANSIHPAQILNDLGTGLAHGLAQTGTVKMSNSFDQMMAASTNPQASSFGQQGLANQQVQQDYLDAHPVNSIAGSLGEQIPQIPLWMAGEGVVKALGTGIGKLAPSLIPFAEKAGTALPDLVKSGLMQGGAYGTTVAPVDNYNQGGNLQSLLQKEEQVPAIALGGAVLHGAGDLAKGISKVGELAGNGIKDALSVNPYIGGKGIGVPLNPADASISPIDSAHLEMPSVSTREPIPNPTTPQQLNTLTAKDTPMANDSVFWNKVKDESGWKGDIQSLQDGIKSGAIDTRNLSMKMDLQKFSEPYQNKYIHETPMDLTGDNRPTDATGIKGYLQNKSNISANSQDILHQYIGNRDTNILNVNNLANDIRNNVKDPLDRMAATHYLQAGGDLSKIEDRLAGKDGFMSAMENKIAELKDTVNTTDMEPQAQKMALKTIADYQVQLDEMNKKIPSNLANLDKNYVQNGKDTGLTYKQTLERATNLDPNTKKWADEALTHNAELGTYSQKLGTVDNLEEYHMAQSWENPKVGSISPDKAAILKEEALAGKFQSSSTEGTGTNHNAHKVYPDYATGIMDGRTPRTMDMADIIQREGVDMASRNANQELSDSLLRSGVGLSRDIVPEGYVGIGKSGGHNVVIPKELDKALNPLFKPDFIAKSKIFKTFSDFQNKLKTVNLGFSLFHYKNEIVAGLSNGDYKAFGDLAKATPSIFKKMEDPAFRSSELDMIKTGQGMTSMVHGNLDTNMKLGTSSSNLGKTIDSVGEKIGNIKGVGKVAQLPVKALEANNKYLFEGVQRFYKVQSYATKVAAYIGKNPSASPAELFKAKGSIAREINGAFGGLNFDSLGTNKTFLGMMRLVMLSPDWTYSNIDLAKQAITSGLNFKDPGGNAAKAYWVRNAIIGFGLLEGGSYLTTGHFTNHNPKGHETDMEVSPNVWASPLSGAMGDAAKLVGDVVQHGTQGIPQFFQGKLAPGARTLLGILTNRDYSGKQIAGPKDNLVSGSLNAAKYMAYNLLPAPFATQPLVNYLTKPDNPQTGDKRTIPGGALLATGLGRYSADKPLGAYANPASAYAGNWFDSLVSPTDGASNDLINKINLQNKAKVDNSKLVNQSLGKALTDGDSTANIFTQNNIPANKQNQMLNAAKKNISTGQLSPLAQKFQGMSKAGQQQLLQNLSPSERSTLGNVKLKTK